MLELPIEDIVSGDPPDGIDAQARVLGESREGRPLHGFRLGSGPLGVSLIAGCHADEPVGPEMLRRLASHLGGLPPDHDLLASARWSIVPDANPDGARRNATWSAVVLPTTDHLDMVDRGFALATYAENVVRELPGEDVEFGFPRSEEDTGARPENRAVARFLGEGAPFDLHASFHGMSFAPGPWFLIEESWAGRTIELRRHLRERVFTMGYDILDLDRGGDKGFTRIDRGFSTRPDSRAMAAHFLARDEPETAELFRPSSMELVRGLGGDPLTFVSEMPLFILPDAERATGPVFRAGTEGRLDLHAALSRLVAGKDLESVQEEAAESGIRPMPIRDQMRLQLAFLGEALRAVRAATGL